MKFVKTTSIKHGYRGPRNAKFDDIKNALLASLENARHEGVVDKEVNNYLDLINSHPDYVTSSSCYGRISLIDLPHYDKKTTSFVCKEHRKISADEYWEKLRAAEGTSIWFKLDPLILHISCRDIEAAEKLLKVKTTAGMKRGGIFAIAENRVQIELEGTYRIETPVKKEGTILVTKEYFNVLVEEANKKFEKNAEMWERFAKEFSKLES